MARPPKLKVYCMPAGFTDGVVAAPSQKAALRAWGTSTDLFATGRASVVEDDPELIARALARPGEVIRRSRGDETATLGPEPAKRPPPGPGRAKRAQEPPPPPPDRSALTAAEIALSDAERGLSAELDAIAAERRELERRESEAMATGEARLGKLRGERDRADRAYAQALRRHERTR